MPLSSHRPDKTAGVLTVLSFTSMYLLLCGRASSFSVIPGLTPRGSHHRSLAQTSVRILVLSTILLYLSNITYIAALIWNRTQENHLISGALDGLFSSSYDAPREMAVFEDGMRKQSPMAILALEVNVRHDRVSRNTRTRAPSHLVSTVDDRGLCCLVARMRDLAQQDDLLHRAAPRDPHVRCVWINRPSLSVCPS